MLSVKVLLDMLNSSLLCVCVLQRAGTAACSASIEHGRSYSILSRQLVEIFLLLLLLLMLLLLLLLLCIVLIVAMIGTLYHEAPACCCSSRQQLSVAQGFCQIRLHQYVCWLCVHRYVSDSPPVIDPYAASALRSSSRPVSPQVAAGGWRGPVTLQTAASSARWAAAALRGRAPPGSALTASHGAGKDTGLEQRKCCRYQVAFRFKLIQWMYLV